MDIGGILSRAWDILWKNKVLWIFGIFAGCASASGGTGNSTVSLQTKTPQAFDRFIYNFQDLPGWVLSIGGVVLVLGFILLVFLAIFLGAIGKIGLIKATHQAEGGQEKFTFSDVFSDSTPYFWRVFLLNLLVWVAVAVVFVIFLAFGIFGSIITLGIGALCFVPMICVVALLIWFVNVIVEQSNVAIVVENRGVLDGLERGWGVVKTNLGYMIVMALVLYIGIGAIGGFIISMPIGLIVMPAVFAAALENAASGTGLMVAGLCFILYLPVFILLNGFLRGYIQTSWTLTFLELTETGEELQPFMESPVQS